ncbi:YolD-like family protein [Salicibibacter cibi]|uniref:YolD-like family protein n=1 Tax=Salicibibacter cibi TaxID=2743001 RepID=A0A7T6ZBW9_9BACI|nr:YolD-like family protein [Salicibibacter cibi]QQK80201.1 YolD-like family protein [Salicibibacter cibi]
MTLPEHREMWLQYRESMKKVEKPEIDEQKWEGIEQPVNEAMEYSSLLEFTYWENGFFNSMIDSVEGVHYLKFDTIANIIPV